MLNQMEHEAEIDTSMRALELQNEQALKMSASKAKKSGEIPTEKAHST